MPGTKTSTDLKDYQIVLATLVGRATLTSCINKFAKIWVETEDLKLKVGLAKIIDVLKDLARSKKGSTSIAMPLHEDPYKWTAEYCKACIDSIKPQWKIIAEQNGWGPKKED
jgi:hypothetical protein